MTRRRVAGLVVPCAMALLITGAVIAWKGPYAGQGRADRPVAELIPQTPPALAGPWTPSYADNGWETSGNLYELGVEQAGTRSWQRRDGMSVDESAQRYTSASLAGWHFGHRDPGERLQSSSSGPTAFDELVPLPPPTAPLGADEIRYFCGKSHGNPGACEGRWAWLRYGQYVVQIQVSNDPSAREGVPPWLTAAIRDLDAALTDRAPRG